MTEEQIRYMTKGPEKKVVTYADVMNIFDRWWKILTRTTEIQSEDMIRFIRDLEIVRNYIDDLKNKEETQRFVDKSVEAEQTVPVKKALVIQYEGMLTADERKLMRTMMKQDADQYGFVVLDNRYKVYEVERGE